MDSRYIEMNCIMYRWMYVVATSGNTIPIPQDKNILNI